MPRIAHYKDRVITLGSSDKARLLFADFDHAEWINFGEDGAYQAYLVNRFLKDEAEVAIPEYYHQVAQFHDNLLVYDDTEKILDTVNNPNCPYGAVFSVYRAGEFGCLIEVTT